MNEQTTLFHVDKKYMQHLQLISLIKRSFQTSSLMNNSLTEATLTNFKWIFSFKSKTDVFCY